jgi:predicted SAM-dependent methyltransferase
VKPKVELKVNKKTRAVEKVPVAPPPQEDLPKPEPIRMAKPENGAAVEAPKVALAPVSGLRLDLACGQTPREGFEGVDFLAPNPMHRVDLMKFPWPWKDNSVTELHSSHFIEHIACREVEERDLRMELVRNDGARKSAHEKLEELKKEWVGRDMFFSFFDECWRILKDGGKMTVVCPAARNDRAFQDPTHRRFIVAQTFLYLWKKWRVDNKLDHYRVKCDFDCNADPSLWIQQNCCTYHQMAPTASRTPEESSKELVHFWNVVVDWSATLIARKER